MSISKATEKRRYKRQNTKVEAVMAIGEVTSIQCVILDFCEQGLFLQLKNPSIIGIQKGKSVKIYFSSQIEARKEYFQIDAQIARIADDGIGVVFDNISESMFNALRNSSNVGSITAHSNNPKFYLTSLNQEKFKTAFREMLNLSLPKLLNEFFEIACDELEKPSGFAQNFRDVSAQNALISVLRINKDSLTSSFCSEITSQISFAGEKSEKYSVLSISSENLSLVGESEFEDSLNFSSLIRKVNSHYKEQLYQLELKLSYVTCFPRYLITNPIDPEHLCEAFHKHIASIDDSIAIKKSLYKAFQTTLISHLAVLYKLFDNLLVENGAPTQYAQDIVWRKNYPNNTNPTSGGSKPEASFANAPPVPSLDSLPSFDNESFHYSDPSYYHEPYLTNKQYRPVQAQPITQTASKLFSLINQSLAANQPFLDNVNKSTKDETSGQPAEPVYSADDLLNALTKLQASKVLQQLPKDATSLLQSQLDETSADSGFFGSKALSKEDKTKLDVYDQLFHALLGEVELTPNIKSYLETIKLPLMALTLQDHNFLDSENHPARGLLNQLFALDSAVNQNKVVKNTQIKQVLEQLMSRIATGSITNPDIFAKANEELKEISAPITRSKEANIRRVIEVYQGKQKLEKARDKIQRTIDNRIAGKTIPSVVQTLLESGWQHLLVITELNDDTDNRLRYLETLDSLLTWYTNLDNLPEEKFAIIIESELAFINENLSSVCTNAFIYNKIMEELTSTLIGTGNPPIRKPFDIVLVETKATEPPKEFISDRWQLEVDQFETGDWFTFSLEKEAFEPLKLVWIGELPEVYVFVNRDGYKKQELSRNQLSEFLESGAAAKIENLDEPVMDRATTNMLQQMQEKLIHSVSHDPVTNLPNRKRFISLIKEQIGSSNSPHVLGYLEIEDFRIITNVCGLAGGDQLLLQIAKLIKIQLGKNQVASRLGDKTFGFLLKDAANNGQDIAKEIRDLINKTNFVWNDKSYTIGVNIALVPIMSNTMRNVEELLQKADSVTISAKRAGHNRIRVYEESDEALKTQMNIHEWAGRIDRIFAENRLFARCQMIAPIDPTKNNHSHYEILLGVRDENGKIIPPDNFIPAVESCQRMPEIDRWVVETVFSWISDNRRKFESLGGFAINLSGQSLNSEEFLTFLKDRLSVQDVPPEKITFEVTETVAAGSLAFTKRFIREIKVFGCKFSLDDFGTGYSSYSYLKSLDVDYLKIDGSFIKDIANSPTDMVMVNSMNEIAHSLELETIAEYVENTTIQAILKEIGVDYAQGYGVHKPMPLDDLADTL